MANQPGKDSDLRVTFVYTADQRLIILCMLLIFVLTLAGLAATIFVPGQVAVIIPMVTLGSTLLSGFAHRPSFPVIAPETLIADKAAAAKAVLETAEKAADRKAETTVAN